MRLFDAHRPVRSLRILPPFTVVKGEAAIAINQPAKIEGKGGKVCLTLGKARSSAWEAESILIRGVGVQPVTMVTGALAPRRYRGAVFLSLERDGSLKVIDKIKRRDYINSVVASESLIGWPREMLKAQAILAQTFLERPPRHRQLCDSTQDQLYLGASAERVDVNAAVASVWGKQLCYDHRPIIVYFHSTCAGGTSNGAEYFHTQGNQFPYLRSVPCKYCSKSPFWNVTSAKIPKAQFFKTFGEQLPVVLMRDSVGRPLQVKLANGQLTSGYDFWIRLGKSFGWDKAPGTRYDLKADGKDMITVESTGAGHGVGLCQWGASELASQGKTCSEILTYYFPGCEIR